MYKAIEARVADNQEMVDFIEKEIAHIQKRNSYKSTKPSKKQVANQGYQETVYEVLAGAEAPMTIADIKATVPDFAEFSTQKISAFLSALVKAGRVERTVVKKVAHFAVKAQ
jgi:hypothetical protein